MERQENYQHVMIKTLLENGGWSTKDQIASRLREFNPKEIAEKDFKNVPVIWENGRAIIPVAKHIDTGYPLLHYLF
jgi:hypothetical protein